MNDIPHNKKPTFIHPYTTRKRSELIFQAEKREKKVFASCLKLESRYTISCGKNTLPSGVMSESQETTK